MSMSTGLPWARFDHKAVRSASPASAAALQGADTAAELPIRCATCSAPIARTEDSVERFGAHAHDRVNPAGYIFRVGCFCRADGVQPVGDESDEFAWFPRYGWCCVACAMCHAHLGWRFSSPDGDTFLGLIVDRLLLP
jgi:hypothetical protein